MQPVAAQRHRFTMPPSLDAAAATGVASPRRRRLEPTQLPAAVPGRPHRHQYRARAGRDGDVCTACRLALPVRGPARKTRKFIARHKAGRQTTTLAWNLKSESGQLEKLRFHGRFAFVPTPHAATHPGHAFFIPLTLPRPHMPLPTSHCSCSLASVFACCA